MNTEPTRCDTCDQPAAFYVYAVGYPCPMIRACAEHIGPRLERDAAAPGSTLHWNVLSAGVQTGVACLSVRPVAAGGEAPPIFCHLTRGHQGAHQNERGTW